LGIIGCGERGTAVISSMSKHTNVSIIAMADLFEDQLQRKRVFTTSLMPVKDFRV
jgi:pyrroline-5-carboxylate reductase